MSADKRFALTVASTPATADDLRWQRLAESARFGALTSVQTTAQRWGATLLAVTGLLTTVTAVLGAHDVGTLSSAAARLWAGVLAGLALALSAGSVLFAGMAAQGKAVKIVPTGPALRTASLNQTDEALCRLRVSRWMAVGILPFFLGALAVVTYGDRMNRDPRWLVVTTTDGQRICATGVTARGPGDVTLVLASKGELVIPTGHLISVVGATTCD